MGTAEYGVRKGQFYRTKPQKKGSHWRYVQIIGISRGQQPKTTFVEVTKSGNKKPGKFNFGRAWLQFREGKWYMPQAYESVKILT